MMVIVGVIKQTGVFDFLAIWAAKRSGGKPFRLMVMLMVITAVASPVLDNVTIIMLVAPVTLVICDRLQIAAQPFLIAEVLASNIGGAATLIGDPPNIIIGSRAGLTFNDFLHRHRAACGPRDQLLAVHPLRHCGDAAVHGAGVGVRLAALLLKDPVLDRR